MRKLLLSLILLGAFLTNNAQFSITAPPACFGQSSMLTGAHDSTVTSWSWDLDMDGVYDDAFGQTVYHVFSDSAGTYSVGLKVAYSATVDSTSNTHTVNPLPMANFKVDNPCSDQPAMFVDSSMMPGGGTTAQSIWDFENDGTDDDTGKIAQFTAGPVAIYDTKLKSVSALGCTATAIRTTQIYNEPVANFSVDGDVSLGNEFEPDQLSYVNGGETIIVWAWDFGDESSSGDQFPKHRYSTPGDYDVTLTLITQNNCQDSYTEKVRVVDFLNPEGVTVRNSIMTPNGDGINDVLWIQNINAYTDCTVKVYNQWNQEVYSQSGYQNDWNAPDMDPGTYFYIIQCDSKEETVGSINILR